MTGHRLKFDPKAADEGLYFVADAGGETPDWGLQIVAFGLTRSVSPVDVAVPAVQSAIVNRQSAIDWSGPEWAAARRAANCVSDARSTSWRPYHETNRDILCGCGVLP